jgi:hypothetical protein
MAVTPSGTISLGNINTALGRSATAAISMDDLQVRLLVSTATSGVISMSDTRNKTTFNGTIRSGQYFIDKKESNIGYQRSTNTGSITGTLYGASFDFFANYNFQFLINTQFSAGNVIPGSITARVRVGTNPAVICNSDTGPGKILFNNSALVVLDSDIGVTRNWQVVRAS